MPKSRTLCAASSAANWFGSTSWTGTSHAIQNPNQSSVNRLVQPTGYPDRRLGGCLGKRHAENVQVCRN